VIAGKVSGSAIAIAEVDMKIETDTTTEADTTTGIVVVTEVL
jgi:hypothetical protein